jgi:hypothetical protein
MKPSPGIGPFRIVREIRRGGAGKVFLAEQETEPAQVALDRRLPRRRKGARRFRGPFSPPSARIARFYDAGGRRTLVPGARNRGEHLLALAARRGLDTRRVGLFLQILDAVDFPPPVVIDLKPQHLVDAAAPPSSSISGSRR